MTAPLDEATQAVGTPADRYEQMLRLAAHLDDTAADLRARAALGERILRDDAVAESAVLCRATWARTEEDVRAATDGRHGLLTRGIEVDADAVVLRATVQTYRWIDDLQDAAYRTLGSIAGRALGYLAPEVALGGAVVTAGLIETDALDRDEVAGYLAELAANNPELMDHLTSGGGGLLDGLQLRSALTSSVLAGDGRAAAARGGLRALGLTPLDTRFDAALRDIAGPLVDPDADRDTGPPPPADRSTAPRSLEQLMRRLADAGGPVSVERVGPGRYIGYLPGPHHGGSLRLVSGDHSAYRRQVVAALDAAVSGEPGARVLLVGAAQGGVTAAEVAASRPGATWTVDRVVTAGAPSAQVPSLPADTRMLALEDRADPVAMLGSLINAGADNRLTVVVDGTGEGAHGYVAAGRAVDAATHEEVRAELRRIREAGYLLG